MVCSYLHFLSLFTFTCFSDIHTWQGLLRQCPLLRTPASAQDWQPSQEWESWRQCQWTLSCVPCHSQTATILMNHPPKPQGRKDDHFQSHLWAEEADLKQKWLQQGHIQSSLHTLGFLGKCCATSVQISKLLPLPSPYPHLPVCAHVSIRYVHMGGMWIGWSYYTEKHLYFESYIWAIMNCGKWSWFLIANKACDVFF